MTFRITVIVATALSFMGICSPIKGLQGGKGMDYTQSEELPYDKEVLYIETASEGTHRILFGVMMQYGRTFGIRYSHLVNSGSAYGTFIGTSWSNKRAIIFVAPKSSVVSGSIDWGNSGRNGSFARGEATIRELGFRRYSATQTQFYETYSGWTSILNNFTTDGVATDEIRIEGSDKVTFRCYGFWICDSDGETLLVDAVPVRITDENGETEGAMYDTISGNVFRNSGTGRFSVGPDL